ncbi:hypothetical protein BRM9_1549 [Methanobacterium formicicum]|uniref:DUF91 domain-containing protein n=1 Tax=Methanobacterium formicicum TaxID=2162 RepID=A0A089ZIC5_METFO|nr:endonuclease NucS domain-containing protein [Methanobacterium formicicum]AIS32363.1 hypothetical protein BRM9_1549 [Methanobacterium formicicum]
MGTEIGVWQIENGKLERLDTNMVQAGRKETEDLEKWIENNPIILGNNILIIGEQVRTKSGPLDFLGIDKSGNLIIIELKRDKLPREALAQAIDYASDVSSWDLDKISEVCSKYSNESLEDYLNENIEDIDLENLNINETQRILLVGFSLDEALERMIEWLSTNFGISINALILKYIKTKGGEEFIARTMIIPEEIEMERSRKVSRKFIPDTTPGTYEHTELKKILESYLSEDRKTPRRIRDILLPLCINNKIVTRDMIKEKLIEENKDLDEGKAGLILTTISREITFAPRDYLRQIIQYEQTKPWEKDNYQLVEKYKNLVKELI